MTPTHPHRRWILVACAAILVGGALRFIALGRQSLWLDEAASYELIRAGGVTDVYRTVMEKEYYPDPLYHCVLYAWTRVFGTSEPGLRSLSAVSGTLSVLAIYLLGVQLVGRGPAAIAACLLAVSPLDLWYSQEGRRYAFWILLLLVSWLLLWKAITRNRLADWLAFAVVSALGVWTFLVSLLQIVGLAAFVLVALGGDRAQRPRLLRFGGAVALTGLLTSPLVLTFVGRSLDKRRPLGAEVTRRSSQFDPWSRRNPLLDLAYVGFAMNAGFSLGPAPADLRSQMRDGSGIVLQSVVLRHGITLLVVGGIAGLALACSLAPWRRAKERRTELVLLLSAALPAVLLLAAQLLRWMPRSETDAMALQMPGLNVRYVIGALPAYLLIVAFGLMEGGRRTHVMTLCGLLAVFSYSDYRYFTEEAYSKEDIRGAVAYLREAAAPVDGVAVFHEFARPVLDYYEPSGKLGEAWVAPGTDATAVVARLRQHRTVFLVESTRVLLYDPQGLQSVRGDLGREYAILETVRFAHVTVTKCERRRDPGNTGPS